MKPTLETQIQALKGIFGDLFAKMIAFALEEEFEERLGDSLVIFNNLEEGEEYEFDPSEEFLFLTWFLFDDVDYDEEPLIQEFQNREGDHLSLQETQICNALKETHLSLMEVQEVNHGETITLRDVFTREEFTVYENTGGSGVVKGSLLFSRVLSLGELKFLVGAGVFLDSQVLEPLTQFVTDQYHQECEDGNLLCFKEFLKWNGELINWWIRALEKGQQLDLSRRDDEDDPDSEGPDDEDESS
jgi:hypothetical protein